MNLEPAVLVALEPKDPVKLVESADRLLNELRVGSILTHAQLRQRLKGLGSWTERDRNLVRVPPPVVCRWGTIELRSGWWSTPVGLLDYAFPPDGVTPSGLALVVCPHGFDSGVSFSNFRACAWTLGVPVFGFRQIRPGIDRSSSAEDGDRPGGGASLLSAASRAIEQVAERNGWPLRSVLLVGYSDGAVLAAELAERWPRVSNGVLIGATALLPTAARWLSIQALGDAFPAETTPERLLAEVRSADHRLFTPPEFRFRERPRWQHLDSRLQTFLAQRCIGELVRAPGVGSGASRRNIEAYPDGGMRLEAVRSADARIVGIRSSRPGARSGVVVSLPSLAGPKDESWLIELAWWWERGWPVLCLPDACPADLEHLLGALGDAFPAYVVLHESSRHSGDLWRVLQAGLRSDRIRGGAWIASSDWLYRAPDTAIPPCPKAPEELDEGRLFWLRTIGRERVRSLAPLEDGRRPVVLAENPEGSERPATQRAREAVARTFEADWESHAAGVHTGGGHETLEKRVLAQADATCRPRRTAALAGHERSESRPSAQRLRPHLPGHLEPTLLCR